MRIRFPRRTSGVVLGVSLLAGVMLPTLTSCTPPPICHAQNFSINLHDSTGAGDDHVHVFANICADSYGNVTSSTGSATSTEYGFLNTFGDVVKATPLWAAGNSGSNYGLAVKGWTNSTQYSFSTVVDVRVGYTIGGVGIAGDNGTCAVTWPVIIISGGGTSDSGVYINQAQPRSHDCHHGFYFSNAT